MALYYLYFTPHFNNNYPFFNDFAETEMKRFLMLLLVIFQIMLLVSCGDSKKDSETSDTTPDGDTDTADTVSDGDAADSSDTTPGDTDTVPDGDMPENHDSEPDEPAKTAEGCYIFTVDNKTFERWGYVDTFLGDVKDTILGDKNERDVFELFTTLQPGIYDLGNGDNQSSLNCTECVIVKQDFEKEKEKFFFQESGTLMIEKVDSDYNIKGTLTAKLVEVEGDPARRKEEVTKIAGGDCIAIENWAFDTGICVPDCVGKVCGPDGCGGKCGEGCSGELTCSKDQKSCVPFECRKITFDKVEMLENEDGDYYYQTSVSENLQGSTALPDIMTLHFYGYPYILEEGTIDLGNGDNANYETCSECLVLYKDFDLGTEEYVATFFQQSGELVFEEVKEGTFESKGHASFRLIEVEIDDYTAESYPVHGGECYEIENMTWDTISASE